MANNLKKKIDIGNKAKVAIRWNVSQTDYSKEAEKSLISLMAQKYGIPEKNIYVETNYLTNDKGGALAAESVKNIKDPKFQLELMKQYLEINDIKDVDFDEIVKIDSQINSLLDYDSYDKGKRYSIKWVKWSNFLSYGPDNYFDFTNLHGLVLLNGEPANKSGKTTFAYDLLHFLLFGKTNTNKAKTLGDLFNNYLPSERTLTVEGCINIDGDDYIIKRTLTRPAQGKKSKTVTNKVEYYKLKSDGTEEELVDSNLEGESAKETTKVIKEALGNESDFDLIISANAKDLDSLISLTETEKGRLLSRWIGLSVIEDKDTKAREKWNKEISVGRYSDMYNQATLDANIESLKQANDALDKDIQANNEKIVQCDKNIADQNKNRDALMQSKIVIDNSLLKIDATTLEAKIQNIVANGKRKKSELEVVENEIKGIGTVDYSEEEYKAYKKENEQIIADMAEARTLINSLNNTNKALENAEYCPTCHRKFDNVDNSAQITKNKETIEEKTALGIKLKARSEELNQKIQAIDQKRALAFKVSQLQLKKATIETDIANGRADYKEKSNLLKEIQKNKEAITKNGEIDARINVINENIRAEENIKRTASNTILSDEKEKEGNLNQIKQNTLIISKIEEERKIERNWKAYLKMIGKDGISKMVLRNTLPIINNELNKLLDDVTDFRVEVVMNEKNDVDFLLIRNDVVTRLSGASGLEKTQAGLALRVVLGKMSNLSKPPFLFLDEILGTVAEENYDAMKRLYDKIATYFEFVLHITHIGSLADWHNSIITVRKVDNISHIEQSTAC